MQVLIACSTFALTVTLAVGRPRVWPGLRISPASAALAGMVCLLVTGTVSIGDVTMALTTLWRPLLTIGAIMLTTAAAGHVGLFDRVAERVLSPRAVSVPALFQSVFVLSLVTASVLSNDAAVLLLTPLVIGFVRRLYPDRAELLVPFAFAVFMAAGVAPFVTSNPMNMIVASYVGLGFNEYALVMVPVAFAGSVVTFVVLRRVFAGPLMSAVRPAGRPAAAGPLSAAQKQMLALLAGVTGTYPLIALIDGSAIWMVAVAGSLGSLLVVWRVDGSNPAPTLRHAVAWDVLIFLPAVFVLSLGLRNVGLVELVSGLYHGASLGFVGVTAALGSAALNNHPMALVNMLALERGADTGHFLAALVGGDLGPRLLPTGSLAGLLWLESCHRLGVRISAGHFVRVGAALTIPTLAVSLLVLSLL